MTPMDLSEQARDRRKWEGTSEWAKQVRHSADFPPYAHSHEMSNDGIMMWERGFVSVASPEDRVAMRIRQTSVFFDQRDPTLPPAADPTCRMSQLLIVRANAVFVSPLTVSISR